MVYLCNVSLSRSRYTARERSGIPLGFDHLLHPQEHPAYPAAPTISRPPAFSGPYSGRRLRLHIRQQPKATRACSAGEKDRRTIDPPPILQLLIEDFNPSSKTDHAILQNSRFTVGCLLYSVQKSKVDGTEELVHCSQVIESRRHPHDQSSRNPQNRHHISPRDINSRTNDLTEQSGDRYVQILSGKTYVSPFHVPCDPDPDTAPHFRSHNSSSHQSRHRNHTSADLSRLPATFFVFADLSVRSAGSYRLQFRLMDWGLAVETGKPQPILAECFSDIFEVYSSKDFPGMSASSTLTWNLKKMGMMELKPREGKGKGVGKRTRKAVEVEHPL